jgi:hypothetical protein
VKAAAFLANASRATDVEWGLGWNLGFPSPPADTPFLTTHTASTFIRILDDSVYLSLSDELSLNGLDVGDQEDLAVSHDATGQTQRYFAKILLNDFGTYATSFVQATRDQSPPLAKLNTLSFTLLDRYGNPISNDDCEYSLTLSITEVEDKAVDTSMLLMAGSDAPSLAGRGEEDADAAQQMSTSTATATAAA